MSTYKPRLHYHQVVWKNPEHLQLECNRDVACRANAGMSLYGFCIRDERGDLVCTRAKGLELGTNIEAKAIAIKEALEYCRKELFTNFIIETDSLSLKYMILKQWKIPWELVGVIEEIGILI
ncbi:hypothetical protein T459_16796 [Capsicum annuum]|uniref:RNase H type-1 domain-containing protein n=1 Tax=Capsicum annuum TaxID=4072 RepID=A0A2G2Z9X2_CAPAN|nr:hypothetical protein T459_16796 [Capsicum annuum]